MKKNVTLKNLSVPSINSEHKNTTLSKTLNKNALVEESKRARKITDLELLLEMVETINKIINNDRKSKEGIIDLLKKLGKASGGKEGISYADKDSQCIRNMYGDVKRHDSNKPNPGGICFEKLYHLSNLDFESIAFTETQFSSIINELSFLKQKLAYVLKLEKPFIQKYLPEKISQIASFDQAEANQVTLKDFETIVDHYYDLKILERISKEIACEPGDIRFDDKESRYFIARKLTIIGELSKEISQHNSLQHFKEALKPLADSRDAFIHRHSKTLVNCDQAQAQAMERVLGRLFLNLKDTLPELIKLRKSEQINEAAFTKLEESCAELAGILEGKQPEQQSPVPQLTVKSDKRDKNNPKGKMDGLINQASLIFEGQKGKATLEQLNATYQSILTQHPELKASYPEALNEANKSQIQTLKVSHRELKSSQKSHQQSSSQLSKQEKKQHLIDKRIRQTDKELSYLKEIELNKNLTPLKKEYIIQHIVEIIGQYMRDIGEYDVNQEVSALSSSIIEDLRSQAIFARNKGLSHDIFSFDNHSFLKIVAHELLPAHTDLQSIGVIRENLKSPASPSFIVLNNLACSYARLGFYNESIRYFREALTYARNPDQMRQFTFDQVGITPTDKAFLIDLDKELLGVDSYQFKLSSQLAMVYIFQKNYEAAYAIFKKVEEKLKLVDTTFATDAFKEEITVFYSNFATTCAYLNSHQEAKDYYGKILVDEDRFFEISLNMAALSIKLNDPNAEIYLRHCAKATRPDIKFCYLIQEGSFIANQSDFDASKYNRLKGRFDELKVILKENKDSFKIKYGDRYLLFKFDLINYYLGVLTVALSNNILSFPEVRGQIENFEKKFSKYREQILGPYKNASSVGKSFCLLAAIFAFDPDLNVTKVRGYYDEAKGILGIKDYHIKQTNHNIAAALSNYALTTLRRAKRYDDAIESFQLACLFKREVCEDESIPLYNVGIILHDQAEEQLSKRNYKQATIFYQKVLNQLSKVDPVNLDEDRRLEQSRMLGLCNEGIGDCKKDTGKLKEAIRYYSEYLSICSPASHYYSEVKQYIQGCEKKIIELNPRQTFPSQSTAINNTKRQEIIKKLSCAHSEPVGEKAVKFYVTGLSQEDLGNFFQELSLEPIYVKSIGQKLWVSFNKEEFNVLKSKLDISVAITR